MQLSENGAIIQNEEQYDENTTRDAHQAINNASSNAVRLEILKLLKEMREDNNNSQGSKKKKKQQQEQEQEQQLH